MFYQKNEEVYKPITKTKELQLEIGGLTPGASYSFKVVAISDEVQENKSDPTIVNIKIPTEEEQLNNSF